MRRRRAFGGSRVIELRSVFSPLALVVFLFVPLLALYAVSSEAVFATDFGSRKALTWTGLAYFALALGCFAAGAKIGNAPVRAKPLGLGGRGTDFDAEPGQRRSLAVLLETALLLSIAAYVLWFGMGVARAGGIGPLLEIWRNDPHRIKAEILTTLPGVTTLTQLAVAGIPLAISFKLPRRGSALRVLIAIALALVLIRTVLFQERLALLELLVPIVFLAAMPRKVTVPRVAVYALVFVLAAMSFFAATELRRTYVYTNDFSANRAATRFLGYYLTSVNNGMVVVDHYPARTPLYSSAEFFWLFPGLRDLRVEHLPAVGTVSVGYADAFGVDPESFWPQAFADQGLDYEFNVFTAPGYLAADFGWAALIALLALGYVSGRLYRRTETSPFHQALYGVWLVGLFEFMRILYFANTRVFPAYLVFLAAYVVLRRRAPLRAPSPSEPIRELPLPTGRPAG